MKTHELRLGNLISLSYDTEKFGTVVAMDITGSIHLGNKENADDIRDIIGLEITESLLDRLGFATTIYTTDHEITLKFTDKRVSVTIDESITYRLRFFHELQNVVFVNTGQELFNSREMTFR